MSAPNYNSHPLPATPPQQRQGQQYGQQPSTSSSSYQRPAPLPHQNTSTSAQSQSSRKSRGFSFKSEKSHKSQKSTDSGHHHHRKLSETSAEKEARRLHSKADPTLAISEAEPAAVAQMSGESDLKPLSSIQHKDMNGNPIADPDRSNPTRSRWERPLETIRSFEAAIDGGYDRKSYYKADAESVNWNRRSSYYNSKQPQPRPSPGAFSSSPLNPGSDNNTRYPPQESYMSGRRESAMLDPRQSTMMGGQQEQSYQEGNDGGRSRYARMQSEPPIHRRMGNRNVYPIANNHRSYETVASGSGSGSYGEPAGYQTDPTSSENSSIERRSPQKRQEPLNDYGINFGQDSSMYQVPTFAGPSGAGRGTEYTPQPPRKDGGGSLLRKVSKVSKSAESRSAPPEKRKSWFSRRFSKNS